MSGTTVEEVILDPETITDPCDTSICLTNCGDHMRLVQKLQYETRIYDINTPISLSGNSKSISCDCPNTSYKSPYVGILKDGTSITPLEEFPTTASTNCKAEK